MKITLRSCIAALGFSAWLAAAGCQPAAKDADSNNESSADQSTIRAGGVDVTVDPGNGVDVDVDGPRGGKVDVGVDSEGVDVDVDE